LIVACKHDPYAETFTNKKPELKELLGSYFPDEETSNLARSRMGDRNVTSRIVLRDDNSFHIENIPDWATARSTKDTGDLVTRGGDWKLQQDKDGFWLLALDYKSADKPIHQTLRLHQQKPPYHLHLVLGDPAKGETLRFIKRY
jgi:hypothetical protein